MINNKIDSHLIIMKCDIYGWLGDKCRKWCEWEEYGYIIVYMFACSYIDMFIIYGYKNIMMLFVAKWSSDDNVVSNILTCQLCKVKHEIMEKWLIVVKSLKG